MKKGVTLAEVNKKLDLLLKGQKLIFKEEKSIETEEESVEKEEESELKELQHIEKEINKELGSHPLTKITMRDIAKGTVGAFIGVVAHFTFFYGIEVAEWLSLFRATLLYPLSFMVGGIFMYATGFRKVKDAQVLKFLPVRLILLYFVSLVVSSLVLFFFSPTFMTHFETAYKQIATVTLIAVIGACTADLIGKE